MRGEGSFPITWPILTNSCQGSGPNPWPFSSPAHSKYETEKKVPAWYFV